MTLSPNFLAQMEARNVREKIAEIAALKAENDRLRELLRECSDELEAEVNAHYGGTQHDYPSEKRRYDRDMDPVIRARSALKET